MADDRMALVAALRVEPVEAQDLSIALEGGAVSEGQRVFQPLVEIEGAVAEPILLGEAPGLRDVPPGLRPEEVFELDPQSSRPD